MAIKNLVGKDYIETNRLIIREMKQSDYTALCGILCDEDVMHAAYGSAFNQDEVQGWLNRHLERYKKFGFGLWAVVLKETNEMIGQCGLTRQRWKEQEVLEIGYLFQKAYWHNGYAAEAAIACKEYAFLCHRKFRRISYGTKTLRGIALRRIGRCRRGGPPQAENPASGILF